MTYELAINAYVVLAVFIAIGTVAWFQVKDPAPNKGSAPIIVCFVGVVYGVAWPIILPFAAIHWTGRGVATIYRKIKS